RAKHAITFRNTKTLSAPALTSTIAAHLASILLTTTVDGLRLKTRTDHAVHREAYQDHVKAYKEALSLARSSYYSTLIGIQQSQPRMLFSTINRLLRPLDPHHPPGALDLCSKFLVFFRAKVDSIHQQLLVPSPPPPPTPTAPQLQGITRPPRCCLSTFSPVDVIQIAKLVTKAKTSTCSLDPMPTALVKAALSTICPIIVDIVNLSLSSGT
ncbi:hypothetical protein JOQ06_006552, partial [Pogonophryne albipinna]